MAGGGVYNDINIMAEFSKIERMIAEQAYETIHRFENLQKQNNTIIHRISHVEDMLAISGCHGNIPNNLRDRANKTASHDVHRLSDEEYWDSQGFARDTSFNSNQADLLSHDGNTYLNNLASPPVMTGSARTHSSPNIRQSVTSDSVSGATTAFNAHARAPRGFPSTSSVSCPDPAPPPNTGIASINSITNIFPKNISNLSKRDNNDVATSPSVISENSKIYQKENVWMKRRSSPVSVLELGRKPPSHDRNRLIGGTGPNPVPAPQPDTDTREPDSTVFLNVGGKRFEVLWHTLGQFPGSRLSRLHDCVTSTAMLEICDRYILTDSEFFFDRSPRHFESILNLYRTGQLHLMEGVCVEAFSEELAYWGLDDLHLEPCCQYEFYRMKSYLPAEEEEKEKEDPFGPNSFARLRKFVWELFEEPNKTKLGKVLAVISIGFVIVSTAALILSTIPAFQVTDPETNETNEHRDFAIAEAIFITWFTIEYLVRGIASPKKCEFLREGMNVIDLLGIVPYFVSLALSNMKSSGEYQDEMRRMAQVFRIMRILRIFRLGRHITGLQTLGATLKESYKELGLLGLVVIMGMLIFSGLTFVVEKDANPDEFISMPAALYWSIITMTSVGYGDITPRTWFGKLCGATCAICGVLIISLPIPIIVNTFNKLYEKAKIKDQIIKKKKMAGWSSDKQRGSLSKRTFKSFSWRIRKGRQRVESLAMTEKTKDKFPSPGMNTAPLNAGDNKSQLSSNNFCGHHLNHCPPDTSKRNAQSLPRPCRQNLSLNLTNLGDILTSCELPKAGAPGEARSQV